MGWVIILVVTEIGRVGPEERVIVNDDGKGKLKRVSRSDRRQAEV